MDDDILTIEEVARYLRVSERTVYDWAQKGEIPSGKIGTVWRFKKTEIERWVNERLSSGRPSANSPVVQIQNIISPDRVLILNHAKKRDALVALAENLATAPQIKNRQELLSEITRREELMSTAIGRGIAIPHCRSLVVSSLRVAFGRKAEGIDFKAIDEKPAHVFFLIVAPPLEVSNQYLPVLGKIAQFAKEEDVPRRLMEIQTPADFLRLVEEKGL